MVSWLLGGILGRVRVCSLVCVRFLYGVVLLCCRSIVVG